MSEQNVKSPPVLKIHCEDISKTFIQKGNQEVPVIKDISLDVYENEFLVVLGPGQSGKSTLLKIIAGLEIPDKGYVTLDGEPILFGVPYPFLSGDGERIAEIAYTQQREGDVRLRLVLTDETGLHAERVLQTSYVREPLRVSFTQDKFELAALDRARVDFTVEQDDYDGTYTVQIEGTPTLFRNLTDDIGPVTGYTVAGNGTYPLRIRPEAVGENPYRITVTDEKGNSAFFDSFVTGIKTVSCFTCSFSKISGGIEVVAEGTYPVMNDLTITLNPTVTVVLRGGATKTLTCTMNVKIEADRMRGRASATLDLGTGYTDYSVTDYEATFSRTASENGMVEYAVQ